MRYERDAITMLVYARNTTIFFSCSSPKTNVESFSSKIELQNPLSLCFYRCSEYNISTLVFEELQTKNMKLQTPTTNFEAPARSKISRSWFLLNYKLYKHNNKRFFAYSSSKTYGTSKCFNFRLQNSLLLFIITFLLFLVPRSPTAC